MCTRTSSGSSQEEEDEEPTEGDDDTDETYMSTGSKRGKQSDNSGQKADLLNQAWQCPSNAAETMMKNVNVSDALSSRRSTPFITQAWQVPCHDVPCYELRYEPATTTTTNMKVQVSQFEFSQFFELTEECIDGMRERHPLLDSTFDTVSW